MGGKARITPALPRTAQAGRRSRFLLPAGALRPKQGVNIRECRGAGQDNIITPTAIHVIGETIGDQHVIPGTTRNADTRNASRDLERFHLIGDGHAG